MTDVLDVDVQDEATDDQLKEPPRATADDLLGKRRRSQVYVTELPVEGGGTKRVSLLLRALAPTTYEALVNHEENKPSARHQKQGLNYNPDWFPPRLVAAVVAEPELPLGDWQRIWNSPEWSPGERRELFFACENICQQGLDLTPFG